MGLQKHALLLRELSILFSIYDSQNIIRKGIHIAEFNDFLLKEAEPRDPFAIFKLTKH